VSTGTLDLTNSTVGVPVVVTGLPTSFGVRPPDFTAAGLIGSVHHIRRAGRGVTALEPPATFTTLTVSGTISPRTNASIGTRHLIQVGAESINIVACRRIR